VEFFQAPEGLFARYEREVEGRKERTKLRIVAFDEAGLPYVVDDRSDGELCPAASFANFKHVEDAHHGYEDRGKFVSMIPAASGWRHEGEEVIAWGLRTTGDLVPLTVDDVDSIDLQRDEAGR